jgi:hypothetical protein
MLRGDNLLRQQKVFNEEHLRRILSKYASYYLTRS